MAEMTKETKNMLGEMRRKIKNESDTLNEAIRRLASKGKENEYSKEEVLAVDNEVRAENGMIQLKSYPVVCDSYSPQSGVGTYKRLVKLEIVREKGKLPKANAIYEECEGVETAIPAERIEKEVDEEMERMFPGENRPQELKAKRSMIRESIIKRYEFELARGGDVSEKKTDEDTASQGPGQDKTKKKK